MSGGPGTGKHTISGTLGMKVLDLNAVAAQHQLAKYGSVDTKELRHLVSGMLRPGMLAVGHLAPYAVDPALVKRACVLRKNPYRLEMIYKKRGYSESKIRENQASETLGITAYDCMRAFGGSVFQVDTTNRTVLEAANAVRRGLGGGTGDTVDWLEDVYRAGDLDRFFPNKAEP